MKKLVMAISLVMILVSVGHAANVPKPVNLTPAAGVVVNGTGVVNRGPFYMESIGATQSVDGAFALNLECTAAGGTADVQIEILPISMIQGDPTAIRCYDGTTDVSVITSSTNTDFGGEGEWLMGFPMCASVGFYLRITGVGSNPADTICKATMAVK